MKIALIMLIATVSVGSARAQDVNNDGYVTILLPIALGSNQTIQGAYGTIWSQDTWLYNASTTSYTPQPSSLCDPPCEPTLPAGSLVANASFDSNRGYGALLHIPATAASEFHINARLLELTRRSQPTGVEIPTVKEQQFLTGATWLLGIPAGHQIRTALRVYAPRPGRGNHLQIDFVAPNGQTIATTVLKPGDDPNAHGEAGALPRPFAGFDAILDVTQNYPALLNNDYYHVRITPLQEEAEFWGFANVTDNETQHVLLITPNQ